MGIIPLEEYQPTGSIDEVVWLLVFLQVSKHLARGGHTIAAELSKNLFECWPVPFMGLGRRKLIDSNGLHSFPIASEQSQESCVLEQQQSARFIIAGMLKGKMQRVR